MFGSRSSPGEERRSTHRHRLEYPCFNIFFSKIENHISHISNNGGMSKIIKSNDFEIERVNLPRIRGAYFLGTRSDLNGCVIE